MARPMPTITYVLHAPATPNPILPEGFGVLPVTINGLSYRATITKTVREGGFMEVSMWMEPTRTDDPLDLKARLEANAEELHAAGVAAHDAAAAARADRVECEEADDDHVRPDALSGADDPLMRESECECIQAYKGL